MDGVALQVGDQILVGKKGTAVIAFANGCEVSVIEPKVITIGKTAPCTTGSKIGSLGTGFVTPVEAPAMPPADGTAQLVGLGFFGATLTSTLGTQLLASKR